jgi:FAD:protein FMN transferase
MSKTNPMCKTTLYNHFISVFNLILLLGASALIMSCGATNKSLTRSEQCTLNRYEYASIHMGSRCSIVLYAPTENQAAEAVNKAFVRIAQVEQVLSDYRSNSESMLATSQPSGEWVPASPTFIEVLELSKGFFEISEGAFDPTVGVYTHLWRSAKNTNRIPTQDELAIAKYSVGFEHVSVDHQNMRVRFDRPNMILDFGAIGKGYAADCALAVLSDLGYDSAIVDLGGDLAIGRSPPGDAVGWVVTVQPGNSAEWSSQWSSSGIATSGDLERHYVYRGIRYSHILDPRTGLGVTYPRAVTVVAEDAATADALASIVSVVGEGAISLLQSEFSGVQVRVDTGRAFENSHLDSTLP